MKAGARKRALDLLGEEPMLSDDSANYFGRDSRGWRQIRGNGCLALGVDKLVFAMWFPRRDLVIERSEITSVTTVDSHLGKRVGRPLLHVSFGKDAAAWWVHDLDRWLASL
jgi:hypothetical protein